jgi:hypothetical protein
MEAAGRNPGRSTVIVFFNTRPGFPPKVTSFGAPPKVTSFGAPPKVTSFGAHPGYELRENTP